MSKPPSPPPAGKTPAQVASIRLVDTGPRVYSAKDVPPPPHSCPTYQTQSGDQTICSRCSQTWPVGSVRACVKAVEVLKKALSVHEH